VRERCLIVDDNERFLEVATSSLSREGFEIVGSARTREEAMAAARKLDPDVVLVDVNLGPESGFDVARALVATFPDLKSGVVLISTRSELDYADLVRESPAIGFIAKSRLSAAAIRDLLASTNHR
jgi:DNA-binding NarL/FixJ family response regulator